MAENSSQKLESDFHMSGAWQSLLLFKASLRVSHASLTHEDAEELLTASSEALGCRQSAKWSFPWAWQIFLLLLKFQDY